MRQVSSSRVRKESNTWETCPMTDLTLEIACRQWPKFLQIPFCLQLDTSRFEMLYCWFASLFCHLLVFPAEKVWYHTALVCPSGNPCVIYIIYPNAGSHEVAVHEMTALGCVCNPCQWHVHTIAVVQSVKSPLLHWYGRFLVHQTVHYKLISLLIKHRKSLCYLPRAILALLSLELGLPLLDTWHW